MKQCSGHMHDLGRAIKRRGMWKYVQPANTAGFAARWLLGRATKDELDPLVIAMLEINAKAARMGMHPRAEGCPTCYCMAMAKDAEADAKIIAGVVDLACNVLVTNGRRAA